MIRDFLPSGAVGGQSIPPTAAFEFRSEAMRVRMDHAQKAPTMPSPFGRVEDAAGGIGSGHARIGNNPPFSLPKLPPWGILRPRGKLPGVPQYGGLLSVM